MWILVALIAAAIAIATGVLICTAYDETPPICPKCEKHMVYYHGKGDEHGYWACCPGQ